MALDAQVQDLTLLLRKEQATRETQTKRIATLEESFLAARTPIRKNAPRAKSTRKTAVRRRPKRTVRRTNQNAKGRKSIKGMKTKAGKGRR